MSEELIVLKEIVQILDVEKIDYVLSGSMAANYYTVPRMTRDIDIVIEVKASDANRIFSVFSDKYYCEQETIVEEISRKGMFNLIHKAYLLKVDFIIHKGTDFQKSMFLRKSKVAVSGFSVWIISLEDLILMKMLWAKDSLSEFQMKDVENLMLDADKLDYNYIGKWVKNLKIEHVYSKLKQ